MTEILALLPERPGYGEAAAYLMIGFILVIIILMGMWFFTAFVSMAINAMSKDKSAHAVPVAGKSAAASSDVDPHKIAVAAAAAYMKETFEQALDPKVAGVIAAACYFTLKTSKYRIISITPAKPDMNWSRQARSRIFQSHTPKKVK